EVLVIDNGSLPETRQIAEFFGVTYITEGRSGISAARNCALRNARGDILAYIDDDCQIDAAWISEILDAFADDAVACVVGRTIARPGSNRVQREFESYVRLGRSEAPFQVGSPHSIYFKAVVGIGANMAFRREVLDRLGGFDEKLRICCDEDYVFC